MATGWEHIEETDRYHARRHGDGLDDDLIHGPLRRNEAITAEENRERREADAEERARAARLRGL